MNIAIIGYGKMGKTIEKLALANGHHVVLRISQNNSHDLIPEKIAQANVAIEFSLPRTALQNISFCLENKIPVVSGTTGWLEKLDEVKDMCSKHKGTFFYASNFSIGVNMLFSLNRYLAIMMKSQPQYNASIKETHHLQKLDHPSGTAITLANDIIRNSGRKQSWASILGGENKPVPDKNILKITSHRVGEVPGTHHINWSSAIDEIQISHVAHSREGFAAGALAAAEWVVGKEGCFGMEDMLGF